MKELIYVDFEEDIVIRPFLIELYSMKEGDISIRNMKRR